MTIFVKIVYYFLILNWNQIFCYRFFAFAQVFFHNIAYDEPKSKLLFYIPFIFLEWAWKLPKHLNEELTMQLQMELSFNRSYFNIGPKHSWNFI